MCGTTTIEFTCGHEDVHARSDSFCAIAYAQLFAAQQGKPVVPIRVAIPNKRIRLSCWAPEPQGFVYVDEICPQCQFRQEKYETSSATVSMLRLSEAAQEIRARAVSRARSSSRSTTSSSTDTGSVNNSSTDTSPRK
ncbi:hypothetical protein N0V93_000681 [Gnomoniopsis smithogilvyi]|uniref:Uncharacterized protein n=1 Tax=Gnomoniopsis smithogilvyi TaxID=1191159 RepID=A0A9W8Z4F7_9PEZI|nr:hypothetical protein N0V93_000681 [Gnomoniopsis smithogilvyi]